MKGTKNFPELKGDSNPIPGNANATPMNPKDKSVEVPKEEKPKK